MNNVKKKKNDKENKKKASIALWRANTPLRAIASKLRFLRESIGEDFGQGEGRRGGGGDCEKETGVWIFKTQD